MGLVNLVFDTMADNPNMREELSVVCERALDDLGDQHGASFDRNRYRQRLRWELGVASDMGLCTAFLVTGKWTEYIRKGGFLVGPGRGATAGALIAYLLGITQVDPIVHQLLPERFFYPRKGHPPFYVEVSRTCDARLRRMAAENSVPAELVQDVGHHGIGSPRQECAPACFEDVVAFASLCGRIPLDSGIAQLCIDVRHKREEMPIPDVFKPFLAHSWNFPLYVEQIVAIAKEVGAMSPQGAMGMGWSVFPKLTSAYARFARLFKAGASARGYSTADIDCITSLFVVFGPSMFTRAHSVSHAHITYWTAWLKAHHAEEFGMAPELLAEAPERVH